MFNSTAELLYLVAAASNHLIAFCFCNLIIVFLLVSSKLGSPLSQEGIPTALPVPVACARSNSEHLVSFLECRNGALDLNEGDNSNTLSMDADNRKDNEGDDDTSELAITNEELEPKNRPIDNDEGNSGEGDDELRQQVEEFIAKVNRRWKAEMLETFIFQ